MCTHGRSDPWVDWEKGTKILFVKFCFGDRSSFRTGNGGESKNISVIFGCCDFLLVVIMIKARQNDAEREREKNDGNEFSGRMGPCLCDDVSVVFHFLNFYKLSDRKPQKWWQNWEGALWFTSCLIHKKKTTLVGYFDGRTKRCEMIRVRLFTCPLADWDFPPLVWGCD